jgi:hypothetical protein
MTPPASLHFAKPAFDLGRSFEHSVEPRTDFFELGGVICRGRASPLDRRPLHETVKDRWSNGRHLFVTRSSLKCYIRCNRYTKFRENSCVDGRYPDICVNLGCRRSGFLIVLGNSWRY